MSHRHPLSKIFQISIRDNAKTLSLICLPSCDGDVNIRIILNFPSVSHQLTRSTSDFTNHKSETANYRKTSTLAKCNQVLVSLLLARPTFETRSKVLPDQNGCSSSSSPGGGNISGLGLGGLSLNCCIAAATSLQTAFLASAYVGRLS